MKNKASSERIASTLQLKPEHMGEPLDKTTHLGQHQQLKRINFSDTSQNSALLLFALFLGLFGLGLFLALPFRLLFALRLRLLPALLFAL